MKTTLAAALILSLNGMPAWGASIGLYTAPDCSSCNLSLPVYTSGVVYVCFTGAGSAPGFRELGLAGVEFRVAGLPSGWIASSVRAPAASFSDGDPFGNGALLAFGSPQTGDCILLYTTTLFATSSASDVVLQVTHRDPPITPWFDCPNAHPWDPPVWGGRQCVGEGALFVNSQQECRVAVKPSTWSQVKQLLGR